MPDADSDPIVFENRRTGRIEVESSRVLHFEGLPGFPEARRFAVVEHDSEAPFAWLVSLDDPDLAFAITDPTQFFPDYRPPVELRHLRAIGVEKPDDLVILAIASFAGEVTRLNLLAPLLINPNARRGEQVVFERSEYSTRHEIPPPDPAGPRVAGS